MQDRYVGDLGDYGKYGLLRVLARSSGLRIGVAWYRVPNEGHNADGKHTSYLHNERFRECDPELFGALKGLVFDNGVLQPERRRVEHIHTLGILPSDTVYHD